jgi:MFS superfamily sulfate permease-like transporter
VSVIVLLLSITGLLGWLTRHIPVPVVKGIQLGAGLSLVIAAGTTLLRPLGWVDRPLDNRLWALLAFVVLIATQRLPRFPYALIMAGLGVVLALVVVIRVHPRDLPHFSAWHPHIHLPASLSADAIGLAVAQLPLTTLNSIIAASALAVDLFPSPSVLPTPAPSVTALGLSVAAMNLSGCWFGVMPVCHGAGGLAAQYRFGARSGSSVIFLGVLKLLLGLMFGQSLFGLLNAFPKSILGILVIAAGLELAKVGNSLNWGASDLWEETAASPPDEGQQSGGMGTLHRRKAHLSDEEAAERWTVMLMTTAGILAFANDAVGFAAGMLCHFAFHLSHWLERRREARPDRDERTALLN